MKNPGKTQGTWILGVNSLVPPDSIHPAQYSWGVNVINRGGIVQTRPGHDCIASLQGVKPQGGCIFTPKNSSPVMLIAVDGSVYSAKYPFFTFTKVDGLSFLADAEIITFQPVVKSVRLNPDGSLAKVTPTPLVIIQDGKTRAGVYDGSTAKHVTADAPFYGVPIGLWMAWVGSRLWVFDRTRGYASDLANPDTFSENSYLSERSNFELPGTVTGAIETANGEGLLVFTVNTTTAFQAGIHNRQLWQLTPDFQKVIVPGVGCVSGRSPINRWGVTWWMSVAGWVNLDTALQSQRTAKIVTVDGEMMRSRRTLFANQSTICSGGIENLTFISVPSGGRYNEHTWVSDQTPTGEASSGVGQTWVSIWTGVRPVLWMSLITKLGREALYFLSYDKTPKDGTNIHVWRAINDGRKDNSGRIACQLETGCIVKDIEDNKFCYAELELMEISGTVDLKVFIGGLRGEWHQIQNTVLRATPGSMSTAKTFTKTTTLESYKPQRRTVKTEEFTSYLKTCSAESHNLPGKDKAFQLLIEWRGRMGVHSVRLVAEQDASGNQGECLGAGEAGTVKSVNERGETVS